MVRCGWELWGTDQVGRAIDLDRTDPHSFLTQREFDSDSTFTTPCWNVQAQKNHALRPVTIYQIHEAQQQHPDAEFVIDGVETKDVSTAFVYSSSLSIVGRDWSGSEGRMADYRSSGGRRFRWWRACATCPKPRQTRVTWSRMEPVSEQNAQITCRSGERAHVI